MTPELLTRHLEELLGVWPPPSTLTIVESDKRVTPGWDGSVRPLVGISNPHSTVLSVPPGRADDVWAIGSTLSEIGPHLGSLLGRPGTGFHTSVFRWSEHPTPGDDPGAWVRTDMAGLPEWLRPFNGDVLIGYEDDRIAAGVGRKQHDQWGHEIAVVTEDGFRGRRWASRLVAQAARRILADGAIPTYLHDLTNHASARTAERSGFPDRGWNSHGLW